MMETKKIVLATHNQGKIREFQKAFAEIGWQAVPIADIAEVEDPEETGTTFEENALQKARCYAKAVDLPVLSDDSGIIACALGDRPGVYSARYAGHHGDDEANNQKLIRDLAPYTGDDRKGYYACVVALVWPDGRSLTGKGTCDGIIRDFYQGEGGFGYDPLFYLPEFGKTMAELSMEEKNRISHRGRALRDLLSKIGNRVQGTPLGASFDCLRKRGSRFYRFIGFSGGGAAHKNIEAPRRFETGGFLVSQT